MESAAHQPRISRPTGGRTGTVSAFRCTKSSQNFASSRSAVPLTGGNISPVSPQNIPHFRVQATKTPSFQSFRTKNVNSLVTMVENPVESLHSARRHAVRFRPHPVQSPTLHRAFSDLTPCSSDFHPCISASRAPLIFPDFLNFIHPDFRHFHPFATFSLTDFFSPLRPLFSLIDILRYLMHLAVFTGEGAFCYNTSINLS
jgi:hypothetical protein